MQFYSYSHKGRHSIDFQIDARFNKLVANHPDESDISLFDVRIFFSCFEATTSVISCLLKSMSVFFSGIFLEKSTNITDISASTWKIIT